MSLRDRSDTFGDDNSVFILIGIYHTEITKKRKKTAENTVYPHGTALAISRTHVFTAYHNIHENNLDEVAITSQLNSGEPVLDDSIIRLVIVKECKSEDWIILKRIDGNEFLSFVLICPEAELPKNRSDKITIKDFPCGLIASDSSRKLIIESSQTKVVCYETIAKSNKKSTTSSNTIVKFPLVKKIDNRFTKPPEVAIRVTGGRSKGSCGTPYFSKNDRVIGFHTESINDANDESISNSTHISYSIGFVFCRLSLFMKEYCRLFPDLN